MKVRRVHHDERVILVAGTEKGVFVYESDVDREKWKRTGPLLPHTSFPSLAFDHRDGKTLFAASASDGLYRSRDLGRSWDKVGQGLPCEKLSHVALGHLSEPATVWAGLDGGRIARSLDQGDTFQEVEGFRRIESAGEWWGRKAGPVVSSILVSPAAPEVLLVAVSVGGVFLTEDGGATWQVRSEGIAPSYPESYTRREAHRDVLDLVSNPAKPDRLYAVAATGIYRTEDGGRSWASIGAGLPCAVTRSIVVSPSKPGTVFVVPLAGTRSGEPVVGGELTVYRSIDAGDTWEGFREGLPESSSGQVMREAMKLDTLDEEGVYFATSQGQIFVSIDEGENWEPISSGGSPVLCLEVVSQQS